jgi:hypothetical protein
VYGLTEVLRQKFFYFDCHSGPDQACPVLDTGESSIFELDSHLDLFSLLPMKDFSFTDPAEMSGFLVNIFDVGGSVHYTP